MLRLLILLFVLDLLTRLSDLLDRHRRNRGTPTYQGWLRLVASCHDATQDLRASFIARIGHIKGTMVPASAPGCRWCSSNAEGGSHAKVTLDQLQEASSKDCTHCQTLLQCILKFANRWQGAPSSDVYVDCQGSHLVENEHFLCIRWPDNAAYMRAYPGRGYKTLSITVLYGESMVSGRDCEGHDFGHPVPLNSGSDLCFDFMKSRIQECLAHHGLCSAKRQPDFLPKRLIDVRPNNLPSHADSNDVRLIDTTELANRSVGYAALSYCWGEGTQRLKPIPMLTATTKHNHLRRIKWADMTKTFEDAITVARRLSLRYIWIDALCIFQDDKDDFAEQASQMASIYGNARLTISATRASTGDVGLFHDRTKPHEIVYLDTKNRASTAYVKEAREHGDFVKSTLLSFYNTPVFARAWCFQERILASRVVHFAERELVWECNEQLLCECGSLAQGVDHILHFKTRQARRLASSDMADESAELELRGDLWERCVTTYTTGHLTYESDRLPALSGYAHELYVPGMGRYLAGLWEFQLPRTLLWQVSHPHLESKRGCVHRPDGGRAPTWSWPSIQGVIQMPSKYQHPIVARIVEASCPPMTADPFGQVLPGGYIVLEAPLLGTVVEAHGTIDNDFGWRPCAHLRRVGFLTDPTNDQQHPAELDVEVPEPSTEIPVGCLLVCAVISQRSSSESRTNRTPSKGLVLREIEDAVQQEHGYRRVGWFNCPDEWLQYTVRRTVKIF